MPEKPVLMGDIGKRHTRKAFDELSALGIDFDFVGVDEDKYEWPAVSFGGSWYSGELRLKAFMERYRGRESETDLLRAIERLSC